MLRCQITGEKNIPTIVEQFWKEGKKEGIAEGRKELKQEVATKLLLKGMDVQSIVELTGLTLEDIQRLKQTTTTIKVSN